MTTLVALPTKDAVVLGCDSLGTVSRPLVDPSALLREFFDLKTGQLLLRKSGEPILQDVSQVFDLADSVPFDHMTDVDKLFSLKPLAMGVMFTGITSIGDRTVKSLLSEFKAKDKAFLANTTNYTVKALGGRLLQYVGQYYNNHYKNWRPEFRPHLELILAGYNKAGPHPHVAKLDLKKDQVEIQDQFWPVFGGQSRGIERIVYGVDISTFVRIEERHAALMKVHAAEALAAQGITGVDVPDPNKEHRIFTDDFRIPSLSANWGDFSEQNAIDCVGYFIRIMRGAQRFSSHMPTVGGAIHVALVDREMGFRFISRREYSHEDHRVPRV